MPSRSRSVLAAAAAATLRLAGPANADEPTFSLSPLVARTGTGWSSSCSHALGYCETQNQVISLRRAFAADARWIVSVRPGTATAMPWVEAMRARPKCACEKIVLVPGESLRVLERPDSFIVVDAGKATALIGMLLDANGEEIILHHTAAPPHPGASEIGAKIVADTERFTDPERATKELPQPVQRLHAKAGQSGCTARPMPREYFFESGAGNAPATHEPRRGLGAATSKAMSARADLLCAR